MSKLVNGFLFNLNVDSCGNIMAKSAETFTVEIMVAEYHGEGYITVRTIHWTIAASRAMCDCSKFFSTAFLANGKSHMRSLGNDV